jgi:protein-tyrosine phosphatase
MNYTEIHFHLLPGVDDGPPTMEATIELARAAAAEGTRTVVATPHITRSEVSDVSILPGLVHEVSDYLARHRIPIEVLCGGELSHKMVGRLSQTELEVVAQGPPGKRWLLLEAALSGIDEQYTLAADELRARGFAVVVAHPERSLRDLPAGWPVLEHELAAGSAMQLNAWSIAGVYGERIRSNAFRVLKAAPAVAIASDAHGPKRMPALGMGIDALAASGEPDPGRLAGAAPRAWLEHGLPHRRAMAA